MECLSENRVLRVAEGHLTGAELGEVEAHLLECEDCRRVLASAAAALTIAPSTIAPASGSDVVRQLALRARVGATFPRGQRIDRYVIDKLCGAGGIGVVYVAHDPRLNRRVALKVLSPSVTSVGGHALLLHEAQAMARLSHPNVVAVHDCGSFEQQVFLAMEFVEGKTLRQWLRDAPRTWAEILDLFEQAGQGLVAAHAAGLVHRDFKPDNVLVGKDGRVRVTDFGLASLAELAPPPLIGGEYFAGASVLLQTATGVLKGTPAYMAPEQFKNGILDARTDQFAFCVALFEAVYGMRPFTGDSIEELAHSITHGSIAVAALPESIPAHVRSVILRGLSTSPDDRFPTTSALLDALRNDGVVKARRRWLRPMLAVAVLAIAIVTGGMIVSSEPRVAGIAQTQPAPAPQPPEIDAAPARDEAPPPIASPKTIAIKSSAPPRTTSKRSRPKKPRAAVPAVTADDLDEDAPLAPAFSRRNR